MTLHEQCTQKYDRPTDISVHWIEGKPIDMGEADVELLLRDTSWTMGVVGLSWSDTGVLFALEVLLDVGGCEEICNCYIFLNNIFIDFFLIF